MTTYRYSEWDGTQPALKLNKDELMDELAQGLMHDSDLSFILCKMQRQDTKNGRERLNGLQKLLQRLLEAKQQKLDKYDLSAMMAEMKDRMAEIIKKEQAAIQQKLDETKQQAARGQSEADIADAKNNLQKMEQKAAADLRKLKNLPSDIGGKLKALQNYEFTDEDAHLQFQDLLGSTLDGLRIDDSAEGLTPFIPAETITFEEAMKLIETLQEMDKLNGQIENARSEGGLETINRQTVRELLGEAGMETLERPGVTRVLEEANFIRRKEDGFELTPLGVRKIGQKALSDVFSQLRHKTGDRGGVWERGEETKRFEFGDNFDIDLKQTIMNALMREQQKPSVKLKITDFEVFKYEQSARSATVLMLDLSLSMSVHDNFYAAKHVALALNGLIRSQFPRDSLHIIGFSSYAREIKKEDLATLRLDQADPYTNIQHGLELARKLLAKDKAPNKQIIIITDGEPTAHQEDGQISYQFSPGARTLQLTLREVENCTRQGITINTFMLGESNLNNAFITRIAKINKGRVFFANSNGLGQYVLVDYLSNRRKSMS
ncbi:MAG: VWA domain-containing protein [Dehalococcoidales bacterium]